MSKIEVNAIEPQSGTTLTLGASGDTITIPAGATISNSGTAAGFGPTGAVSWNTTKITANPNPAVTGVGYFCDTTTAAFTVTLPLSPSAGAVIGIADYANTFATNNLTVGRNGSNIGGVATNAILSTNGLSVTFVYVDATQGWIVTDSGNRSDLPTPQFVAATGGCIATCGNFKIHTFTGPGTFTVTSAGNPLGSSSVDYLVVAGGGGGSWDYGGGGGGGFRYYADPSLNPQSGPGAPRNASTALTVSATGYPITVGGGGTKSTSSPGTRGVSSIFSTITSTGGGGGSNGATVATCAPGGSGGGGGNTGSPTTNGIGNTPPVSPSQGSNGGNGLNVPGICNTGGGGGGAMVAGTAGASPYQGGPGGAGAGITGFGTSGQPSGGQYYFSGGGGANGISSNPTGGIGGAGRGKGTSQAPLGGTDNTGGGGGGGCTSVGAGGSGIVVIRYKFQ